MVGEWGDRSGRGEAKVAATRIQSNTFMNPRPRPSRKVKAKR